MKSKLALLEVSPSSPQNPKTFQPKNKSLVAEIFDWDEEEVFDDEKFTQEKVLMALADDELTVGKNHAHNNEWVDITMRKRLSPGIKLLNFNTGRILVPKSQAVNESLETLNTPESSKDSEAEFLTPLPPLKNLQGASPSSKVMPLTFQPHSLKEIPRLSIIKHTKPETHDSSNKSVSGTVTISGTKPITSLVPTEVKDTEQESKLNELTKVVQIPDDCRSYPECEIYRSYDHFTLEHNRVIHIRGGVLDESSQSNESSIRVKCNICGSTRHIRKTIWYLDSGCSRSMTGVKSYLHKYVEQPDPKVVFGDNSSCITEGYGSINCGVSPMSINHEKYTIVIVDEYSRYTWEYFLRKKSQAPEMIMSFIRMDHLGKFDAKADDGYFLGYSSFSKAFTVYNIKRQQIKETYHVTFNESIEAIMFTNTSVDEIGIDDSSIYPPDEFQKDDPYRQYQVDSDVSYYIIPHKRSLTKITQENHVPEVIAPNDPEIPHTEILKALLDRWLRDQHIELVNIIGNHKEGMLTRRMAAKLTAASANECLFADFLSEIEPKKNKKDEHGTTTKNKSRLVAQGYSQEEGIDYDETFTPVARMEAIRIFLAFATYTNFKVYQIDVKSTFLNDKLKEEVYVKQSFGFESNEFPNYVCKLDKALYIIKQEQGHVICVRYQSNPKESHLRAVKRILRRLSLGGKLVCWSAKKQQSVAMSSAEAKYVAASGCCAMGYQNILREFWSTVVAFDHFSSTDEPEKRPLKEFLIKFLVLNGQRPLTLDFNTFCSSTGLNYNNGKYTDHLTPKVLGENCSSTEQVNSIQQLLAYSLIVGTKVDIGETIYSDLVTKLLNKFRFLLPILSNSNFTKDSFKFTHIELTDHMIAVNNQRNSMSPLPLAAKLKKRKCQTDKEEKIKKSIEEIKLLAMFRPEVIKKKNSVVKDLLISLSKRYERLKKILEELGIQSALPAPVPKQVSSQTSGSKRMHMELEPEIKVPGLECNRSLPGGVPFVNNMVIEEPKYGIFFTDVFGDRAFQTWDDIYKVGIDSLVSYQVMASMVKTEENARFSLKLLITDHPYQ
nr:hypothetical protein [Tanacetum cinerariifolium]